MKRLLTLFIYLIPIFVLSQEISLTGNIIDKESGSPMSGATIQIVNSDVGVVSDFDGNFLINIKIGEKN